LAKIKIKGRVRKKQQRIAQPTTAPIPNQMQVAWTHTPHSRKKKKYFDCKKKTNDRTMIV
jgi:hypothetical protein